MYGVVSPRGRGMADARRSECESTPTQIRCDRRLAASLDDLPGAVHGVARDLCYADSFPNLSVAIVGLLCESTSSLSLVYNNLWASYCLVAGRQRG